MFPDITRDDIFRLETPRLWLRWLRAADSRALGEIGGFADIARMAGPAPDYTAGDAERFILHARATTASGRALILGITLKTRSRTLIGIASAQAVDAREVEVGYVVAPPSAGSGYATEATSALIDAVFNLTEVLAVTARSRADNAASRRVLEKCGCLPMANVTRDAKPRGDDGCDVFAIDRRQWSRRHRTSALPAMMQQSMAGRRDDKTGS